jgi:hypothetical protein
MNEKENEVVGYSFKIKLKTGDFFKLSTALLKKINYTSGKIVY